MSLFPWFSFQSGLSNHCFICHWKCRSRLWNSSSFCSHKFQHICINNFCFLFSISREITAFTSFLQIPFWNILFKSSIRLYLLNLIPIIHIFGPNIKTIGILKENKWTSRLKKSRFLYHCRKGSLFNCLSFFYYLFFFIFCFFFHFSVVSFLLNKDCVVISELLSGWSHHLFCIFVWCWDSANFVVHVLYS